MAVELADNIWVIFAAYVAAFLPWTLISSSFDFISPVWKTVSDTWTEGVLVIIYSTIPAVYILFYIVLQAKTQDFKEMFAAIVALLFSLLYIFRAVWGLWKLRIFRNWVAHSIINLENLGITYESIWESENLKDPFEVADGLFVNDTVIDNQLSSGSCPCYIKYGSHLFQLSSNHQHGFLGRFLVLPARLFLPVRLLLHILKDLLTGKRNVKLQLIPEMPVDVWLNWAVVFASQGLENWTRDFDVAQNPEELEHNANLSNAELFQQRQRYFAAEVLASAALQFWPPETECDTMSPMLWKLWGEDSDVYHGKVSKEEFLRHAIQSGKGLPFNARHDLPEEVERTRGMRPEGYVQSYTYVAYSRQLRRVRVSVPAGFGDWIEEFDIRRLEWLAVMLNLGAYATEVKVECESYKKGDAVPQQAEDGSYVSQSRESDSSSSDHDDRDEIVEQLDCRDLAVENLLDQLGLDKVNIESTKKRGLKGLCAFPLPDSSLNRVARGNRLVLQIGEMIDIWCALEAGRQLIYLKGFGEPWDVYCRGYGDMIRDCKDGCGKSNTERNDITCDDVDELAQTSPDGSRMKPLQDSERLFEAHLLVETTRCMFQLSEKDPRYWHMEQTISFMGYSMEFVRTELAAWKKGNEESELDVWTAQIGKQTEEGVCMSERIQLEEPREEFRAGILHGKKSSYFNKRSIQVRLIWEIQRALEDAYKRNKKGPQSVELMMLCVLSFPSLSVTVEEGGNGVVEEVVETQNECAITLENCWGSRDGEAEKVCSYKTVITPQCAPQEMAVVANLTICDQNDVKVSVHLRGVRHDGPVLFMWEWWRDAFTGRLKACMKWQIDHEFGTAMEVRKTVGPITGCIRKGAADQALCPNPCDSWSGWLPFRTSVCRFELESPKFLWEHQHDTRSHDVARRHGVLPSNFRSTNMSIPIRTYCSVAYEEVERNQLRHFNLVIREVGLNQTDRLEESEKSEELSIVDRAKELFKKGPENFSRAMILLETAVTNSHDMDALELCMDKLLMGGENQDIGEALSIANNYFSTAIQSRSILRKHANDEQASILLSRLKDIFNKIGREDRFSDGTIISLSNLLMIAHSIEKESTSDTLRVMEKLLIRSRLLWLFRHYLELVKTEDIERNMNMMRLRILTDLSSEVISETELASGVALYHFVCNCYWRSLSQEQVIFDAIISNASTKNDLALHLATGAKGVAAEPLQAKALYEEAIDEGSSAGAMNNLGYLLQHGAEGVPVDAVKAKALFEDAIKEGRFVLAMSNLGCLLFEGAEGVPVDAVRAKTLLEEAINEGRSVHAMYNLGCLLQYGAEGVPVDTVRAKALYEDAIEEWHDADAMNRLGRLLHAGAEGVLVDAVRAKALYEDAIKEGRHVTAMCNLACLLWVGAEGVPVDAARAKALYEDAIKEGRHVHAMYNLGCLLRDGAEGVSVDAARAKALYEDAIKEGRHVNAMYNLGCLLEDGAEGVPADAVRAKALYEDVINEGSVPAMNRLGLLLQDGAEGVPADAVRAKALYEDAINEGSVPAMNRLGLLLHVGAEGVPVDAVRAKALYEEAINEGRNVYAMYNLGSLLQDGMEGVPVDAVRAKALYEDAINEGSIPAMKGLGILLQDGAEGVPIDAVRAKALYEDAIREGRDVDAMNNLAYLLQHGAEGISVDAARAKTLYEEAINEGRNVHAMDNLAYLLQHGAEGVPVDAVKAKALYEDAINEGGNVYAMFNLGCLLEHGAEGVAVDKVRAKALYEDAIEEGHGVDAMNSLGVLLDVGAEGVPVDAVRAKTLYEDAINEGGNVYAMYNLGCLLQDGAEGVPVDTVRAKALYEDAINEGFVPAMNRLGLLLDVGAEGVPVDAVRAKTLYEEAINEGRNVYAMYNLGRLLQDGAEGVPVDAVQARALYEDAIEEGHDVDAMKRLADLLESGAEGVARDEQRANELRLQAEREEEDTC